MNARDPRLPDRRRESYAQLLGEIAAFCQRTGMAESTFGRQVVNDGKLVTRLRFGSRITPQTAARIRAFLELRQDDLVLSDSPPAPQAEPETAAHAILVSQSTPSATAMPESIQPSAAPRAAGNEASAAAVAHFRFYDNRQKYLMFVHTCNEKWVIAERVSALLEQVVPRPPALRVFDAGVGDGSLLTRVMRSLHDQFPTVPFYLVGKEISLEDVRVALEKMADRFHEHPATVLVMTNMYYSEAPWLRPSSLAAASGLVWHEVALRGNTAGRFDRQISDLAEFLEQHWTARISPSSGNPLYERPVVLVIYRDDHKLLLDAVRPRQGAVRADFDLVIASQPYRARASAEFKAAKVIAPLARALGPGGRLLGIHSHGRDPGLEIVTRVWPGEAPFSVDRYQILKATKQALGVDARGLSFNALSDQRALFRYQMHTLPTEISAQIGTSTLMAAWNAAVYVAQIDDVRLTAVMGDSRYLDATRQVLQKHGRLWFQNESFVIARHTARGLETAP